MSALDPEVGEVLRGERRWWVVEGDCLGVLPLVDRMSVDHTITDAPYEAEAHTLQRRVKRPGDGASEYGEDERVAEIEALSFPPLTEDVRRDAAGQIARITRRWAMTFCQVEAAMRWRDALTDAGATYRRTAVWVKPDAMPQFSGDRPGMGYESLLIAHAPGRSRWNGGGRVGVFTHNKNSGGAHEHETQKPLPLMLELVELFTDPGELVLDPFTGSGTTGVACLRLGRRFLGVEKSPKYAALARERLEAESKGLTLRDARHGQLPLLST